MASDIETFKALWMSWKAGRGSPSVDHLKLLATAKQLLRTVDDDEYCAASLRYLQQVRKTMLARVQAGAGQPNVDPLVLCRGIRGGSLADDFGVNRVPETGRLLSYSIDEASGRTFASMGNDGAACGVLYRCSVLLSDIVFFEDNQLCDAYLEESEVLVLHHTAPLDVTVIDASIKPRAKIKFAKKPTAHGPS
ncbi:MAG: hypothetical protein WDO69_33920 [Pseudomonadota bacterium]